VVPHHSRGPPFHLFCPSRICEVEKIWPKIGSGTRTVSSYSCVALVLSPQSHIMKDLSFLESVWTFLDAGNRVHHRRQ
jgi:hypothetical protein